MRDDRSPGQKQTLTSVLRELGIATFLFAESKRKRPDGRLTR